MKSLIKTLAESLTLPVGDFDEASYSWVKVGGYAGESAIKRVYEKAVDMGWTVSTPEVSLSQMGLTERVLTCLDGHVMTISSRYGSTRNTNRFSIKLQVKQ